VYVRTLAVYWGGIITFSPALLGITMDIHINQRMASEKKHNTDYTFVI